MRHDCVAGGPLLLQMRNRCGWASSNPDVAEISSDGVTTARRDGTAEVAASYEGKRATARVSVTYGY